MLVLGVILPLMLRPPGGPAVLAQKLLDVNAVSWACFPGAVTDLNIGILLFSVYFGIHFSS